MLCPWRIGAPRLLRPLRLSTGDLATHYLRDFWIRAAAKEVAVAVVRMNVSKDGARVSSLGEISPEDPTDTRSTREASVIMSGRIYFTKHDN